MADEEKLARELELENESVLLGVQHYRNQVQNSSLVDLPPGIQLLYRAIEPMAEAIKEFISPRGPGRLVHLRKIFSLFEPEELAYITARHLLSVTAITPPLSLQDIAVKLGKMIKDQLEYKKFKTEQPFYFQAVKENLKTNNLAHKRTVILRAKRLVGIEDEKWDNQTLFKIGIKLIELFSLSTGLIEKIRVRDKIYLQIVKEVEEWVKNQHARYELLTPFYLPMVVPPKPWETTFGGGFLTNFATMQLKLIKTNNNKLLLDLAEFEMPLVYQAINAVQNTPWRINKKILQVLKEVWELGNEIGDLPPKDEIPLPPKFWNSDEEFEKLKQEQPELIKKWKRQAASVYEQRLRTQSKRLALIQKIWIAEKFKDEEEFYFVWSLDWRGRMYPIQGFVNPQIDDSGKALLEFAKGKPISERGAFWLAVHLANKFGNDKVSFEDRVKWVQEHEKEILDSAKNPVDGLRFWDEADEPFQFLAACFEWAGYKEQGENFVSHLPIALDGSCNGLQNFSAMLLDEIGGRATNLVPQEKPADVYQEVANVVIKDVEEDAKRGDPIAQVWLGKIDRGIVKRNVMTLPYGATKFGFRDQLLEELKKRDTSAQKYLEVNNNEDAALYLANKTWTAIGEVVIAARAAMAWLQEVARIVAKVNIPIKWITPAGFPVVQNYRKLKTKRLDTVWGGIVLQLSLILQETEQIDKRKQANGISPNFVHSMDASHLMLTIDKCLKNGITDFSFVHDSYATHAANTDMMAKLLREAFVEQYSQDVLHRFKEEIVEQLKEVKPELIKKIPPIPEKGKLKLDEVKNSKYFFA